MFKSILTRAFAVVAAVAVMGLAGCKDNAEAKPEITSLDYTLASNTLTVNGKNFGANASDVMVLIRYAGGVSISAPDAEKAGMISYDGDYFYAYTPSSVTATAISVSPGCPWGEHEVRVIVKSFTAKAPNTIIMNYCD